MLDDKDLTMDQSILVADLTGRLKAITLGLVSNSMSDQQHNYVEIIWPAYPEGFLTRTNAAAYLKSVMEKCTEILEREELGQ